MHNAPQRLSKIIEDNEAAVAAALLEGRHLDAFLLVHALIEALLRIFLDEKGDRFRFVDLIAGYEKFLEENNYPMPTFVTQLSVFNRRRNRVVHQLWRKGLSNTNSEIENTANAAVTVYCLFIEWLRTFDEELEEKGFRLSLEEPSEPREPSSE